MNVTQSGSDLLLAAEEGAPNPLLPHVGEIILGIVVFLILVGLVYKFVVPAFETAYAERTEAIEGGLKRAEKAQAEADAALEQYKAQLADARHESARIREDAREQGANIVGEMRQQAQTESQRIVSTAHAQIDAERQQVVHQLRAEIGSLATTLAERIVGESLEDEVRQRRSVERFIAELEAADEPDAGGGDHHDQPEDAPAPSGGSSVAPVGESH
ncbi:MAG: F0F1 ATP synthase subunit B [Actinomycetota bacterium]|nr:F0F1 ATP synthase subunit B [Actinomycetota bacterium]